MFSGYIISVAIFVGIWVTLALSLNILTGYAGQVSLGHAAFFGLGSRSSVSVAAIFLDGTEVTGRNILANQTITIDRTKVVAKTKR